MHSGCMVTTAFGSHWIFVSFGKLSRSSIHTRHGERKEDARGKERRTTSMGGGGVVAHFFWDRFARH